MKTLFIIDEISYKMRINPNGHIRETYEIDACFSYEQPFKFQTKNKSKINQSEKQSQI